MSDPTDWRLSVAAQSSHIIPIRAANVQKTISKLNNKTSASVSIDVPAVLKSIGNTIPLSTTTQNNHHNKSHKQSYNTTNKYNAIVKSNITKTHHTDNNTNSTGNHLVYDIPILSDNELYSASNTVLPELELFDSDAVQDEYKQYIQPGVSVPAIALYYGGDKKWAWRDCRIIDYNVGNDLYTAEFDRPIQLKQVKRLGIQFKSENPTVFHQRLQRCTEIRDNAMANKRYMSFIECQSDSIYTPINDRTLHGIVNNLISHNQYLLVQHQQTVEQLLIQIRQRYGHAMKYSVVELMRRDPVQQGKLSNLRLPPPLSFTHTPYNAVVDVYNNTASTFKQMQQSIRTTHIFHNIEATSVILAWLRSYHECSTDMILLDCTVNKSMSLYDYMEHQDKHLKIGIDKLQSDWRGYLINLIRDNLNSVFKLFVNDLNEYNNSQLSSFLRLINFMSRQQLHNIVQRSLLSYNQLFDEYNNTTIYQHRPMLTFKLSVDTTSSTIVFIPSLSSVVDNIVQLIDLPSKIQVSLHCIDNDVVPLLGLTDRPILQSDTSPDIYQLTSTVQGHVREIVQKCIERPVELLRQFDQYNWIIQCNADVLISGLFETINGNELSTNDNTVQFDNSMSHVSDTLHATNEQLHSQRSSKPQSATTRSIQSNTRVSQWTQSKLKHSVDDISAEINRFSCAIQDIQYQCTAIQYYPLVSVDITPARDQLSNKAKTVVNRLLHGVQQNIISSMNELIRWHEQIITRINKKSSTVAELAELKSYVHNVEQYEIHTIRGAINEVTSKFEITKRFSYVCSNDTLITYWHVQQLPRLIYDAIHHATVDILNDNVKFQKLLKQEQYQFNCNLVEYTREVNHFSEFGIATAAIMESYATRIEQLNEKLEKADVLIESFQQREQLFSVPVMTQYPELDNIRTKFQPYFDLWSVVSLFNGNYSMWTTGSFVELDPPAMTRDVNTWIAQTTRLQEHFSVENCVKPLALADDIKLKITDFMQYLPIIHNLRLPTLRPRHWDKLTQLLTKSDTKQSALIVDSELTLAQLISYQPLAVSQDIDIVACTSSYEYTLEQQLDVMLKQWQTTTLNIQHHHLYPQQYILVNANEILSLLVEQLKQTTTMRSDAYIQYFQIRTRKWENRLTLIQQIVVEWIAVQSLYFALRSIFTDDTECKKIPAESRRYNVIQQYYTQIVQAALKNKNIIEFVADTDNLLKTLKECHKMLDTVIKQLPNELTTKHNEFITNINNQFIVQRDQLHKIIIS